MEDRLVIPVWHNQQVHADLGHSTHGGNIRKRTPYNCGNYVDVGGHGAVFSPTTLALRPSRRYVYTLAATGPISPFGPIGFGQRSAEPVAFAAYESGSPHGRILYGGPLAGLHALPVEQDGIAADEHPRQTGETWQNATSIPIGHDTSPIAVKVLDSTGSELATCAVRSGQGVCAVHGSNVVARVDVAEVDAFTSSPFLADEIAWVSRGQLNVGGTQLCTGVPTASFAIEDVSFWTHPRHLALVACGSLTHVDVRDRARPTKLVDASRCSYLLPKELLFFALVNPRTVNQVFLLASDTVSVWDVRYCTQPMAVFNHYLPRSKTLLGLQALQVQDDDFLLLVRSSERSTVIDLDPCFPEPNIASRGLQLQFGCPADLTHFYRDQCGNDVPLAVSERFCQPCVGSCLVPFARGGTNDDATGFQLITITASGDWFQQELRRTPTDREDGEVSSRKVGERTFAYGLDAPPLDENQLEKLRTVFASFQAVQQQDSPGTDYAGPFRSVSLVQPFRQHCISCGNPIDEGQVGEGLAPDVCRACENTAPSLAASWPTLGLLRQSVELTVEEETRYKKMLGADSGFVVSDSVRATWGDVEWRVDSTEAILDSAASAGLEGHGDTGQANEDHDDMDHMEDDHEEAYD